MFLKKTQKKQKQTNRKKNKKQNKKQKNIRSLYFLVVINCSLNPLRINYKLVLPLERNRSYKLCVIFKGEKRDRK